MSEPYLVVAYWQNDAPDYCFLARALAEMVDAIGATMTLQWVSGGYQIFDRSTATSALASITNAISGFAIDLVGGASISTSSWGRSGRIIEIDLRPSERGDDRSGGEDLGVYHDIRNVVGALIKRAGASFVWITRVQGDVDGVSTLIEAFDMTRSGGAAAPALPLDQLSHAGWLFAWSSAPQISAVNTAEKVQIIDDVNFVELVNDRPIDLKPGWITPVVL
jgi:hypothetical protein